MMPGMDEEMMFDDPMLMQQLGLGGYMQPPPERKTDEDKPPEGSGWSMSLIVCGILLILAWMAIPLGALGAWFYGPIQGFAAEPVFSRFEFMIYTILWLTIGVAVSSVIMNSLPKVQWVENDPGMPRTTYLKKIEDMGGHYILTRRDKRKIRVRKDICSRYKNKVHVTANVLEINARAGSDYDIDFRTTQGRMSRGAIEAEEDLAMRQAFREEQLEQISGQFVQGQLDQIEGGMM